MRTASSIEIHPVSPAEYPRLVAVWEASVRATHHFLNEADIQFFKPLILNEFFPAATLHAAKDDQGELVGFLGVVDDKLEMLFVDPERRGQGIGRHLLDYAVQNLRVKTLDVNEQNEQAVGFYQRMGFEIVGRSARDGMGKPFPLLHLRFAPAKSEANTGS